MPYTRGERLRLEAAGEAARPRGDAEPLVLARVGRPCFTRKLLQKRHGHHPSFAGPRAMPYHIHPMDPGDTGVCITQIHAAWHGSV